MNSQLQFGDFKFAISFLFLSSLEISLTDSDQTLGLFPLLLLTRHQCSHPFQQKMKLGVATVVVWEEMGNMTIDHGQKNLPSLPQCLVKPLRRGKSETGRLSYSIACL
jgi:hypothetical protein